MVFRFAAAEEIEHWNVHILDNPDSGNVFQGYEFAKQKEEGGWLTRFVMGDDLALLVLEKSVAGFGKLWYIPKGPGVVTTEQLLALTPDLRRFAARQGVFMVRMEPEIIRDSAALAALDGAGLVKTKPIQPNFSTITLDITPPLEEILLSLPQKGRYAIRRAEREGVQTKPVKATDQHCQLMYDLLRETALDAGFGIRPYEYYRSFWQRYETAGLGQLFFAYVDADIVAGAYAMVFGTKSTYKDGASIRKRVVYGASHLLQWEVIDWAKAHGAHLHDLCGAPPADQINNPEHPHYGIGLFKTGFNKTVTEYVGAYDIVVRPLAYRAWSRLGERVVRRLYYRRHKQSYF